MRYKLLGKSGLRVSELCLGTMTFGEDWGWGTSPEESKKVFDAYAAAGGNFIDTANRYTNGSSEKIVGDLVAADRDYFVLATKYSLNTRPDDPNASGNHRKNLVQSLDASLKRLDTDYIDLYWVHAWDFMTPVEEVMQTLNDVVRSGKVLYVGISDTPAWIVSRANMLAGLRGWTPFIGLQIEYSLIQRTVERELLPMAQALNLGVMAWSPLASGLLSGKYTRTDSSGAGTAKGVRRLDTVALHAQHEQNLTIARTVDAIADEIGQTSAQVAINWVRQQGEVIPVLGARKASQLQDNLACLEFTLTTEQMERLNEVSQIELGFPHDFLHSRQESIYGNTLAKIDHPTRL
ncbi:MAG: aldo/keto reductase [Chloroflexota bacterium]